MSKVKVILISISFLIISCKNSQVFNENDKNETKNIYDIINAYIKDNKVKEIYFMSYKNDDYDFDKVKPLINHMNENDYLIGKKKIDSMASLGKLNTDYKDSIARIYIKPQIEDFLGYRDLEDMKSKPNISIKWDKNKIKNAKLIKIKDDSTLKISVPILNREQDISLFYVESSKGLDLKFYKRNDSIWKYYCSALIYTED
ncbi:hypothetical protein [Galbibacter sp. PAP.153]|uniref:hypothetical protein n=1 Tax=Galbibacter sp. PAP.153 TaxID=3104623 RepID=UPI003009DA72